MRYRCKALPKAKITGPESWHLNLRGGSQPRIMKQWVTKNKTMVETEGHLSVGFSVVTDRALPRNSDLPSLAPQQLETTSPCLHLSFLTHTRLLCQLLARLYEDLSWWGTYGLPALKWLRLTIPTHCFASAAKRIFLILRNVSVLFRGHYTTNCKRWGGLVKFVFLKSSISEIFQMSWRATIS